uniref:Glycosyl transferase family 1 n=1 Tax=Fundidesulfovibrio putealis TaxID=270496 RepID=A0A7C3W8E2_9BACT
MPSPRPPRRPRIRDELGLPKSLPDGHRVLRPSVAGRWLVLGLGPDPAGLAAVLAGPGGLPPGAVSFMECPDFAAQCPPEWRASIPADWTALPPHNDTAHAPDLSALARLWADPGVGVALYSGAQRLFPDFWGPVLAALALPDPAILPGKSGRTVLLPQGAGTLLTRELSLAFSQAGFAVEDPAETPLEHALRQGAPELFFSVNFAGLDDHGQGYHLLRRAGTRVATWLVDNPFHALSRLKSRFWQRMPLFVTDASFLPLLRAHGARDVHHLPLAAGQHFFDATPDRPDLEGRLLFVGRSAFPGREDFFAGEILPPDTLRQALAMLEAGERPDFLWWTRTLNLDALWPGKAVRRAGLGAEECGQALRARVIEAASRAGRLSVCGDDAWRDLAAGHYALLPPVDYYGPLAGMYASARCVLGATSPLLPAGLTQRHFDVWAAGGCLLSDATPGLELFPRELIEPITYRAPADIPHALARLERDRQGLTTAWRERIARDHTYDRRVALVLDALSDGD